MISIHAPREGERPSYSKLVERMEKYFNPRSPRGGATCIIRTNRSKEQRFQSTLPARGSDDFAGHRDPDAIDFNPRSPRGGATYAGFIDIYKGDISIHAPREGERLDIMA